MDNDELRFSPSFPRSRKTLLHAAALIALAGTMTACLGAPEDTDAYDADDERIGEVQEAVIGGSPASVNDWPAVVGVGDEQGVSCTGTLIAPRAVLTAGHCTAKDGMSADPTRIYYGADNLQDASTKTIAVTKVDALGAGFDEGMDIAILTLAEDAPMAPVPLATSCGAATEGGDVTLVGYGVTDANTASVLYSVNLKVDTLTCNDTNIGCPASGTGAAIVSTPGGMCGGDSGGPLFVSNSHGKFVAGVVSGPSQAEASDDCSDWQKALYPRPDTVEQWIADKVGPSLAKPNCDGSGSSGGETTTSGGASDGGGDDAMAAEGCSMGARSVGQSGFSAALAFLALVLGTRRRRD